MAKLEDLIAGKDELFWSLIRKRKLADTAAMAFTVRQAHVLAARNVHGAGVGYKEVNGKRTRTLCIRLYVAQKLPRKLVPREALLPGAVARLPTDVIEWPVGRALAHACSTGRRLRLRPPMGGISAAHREVLRTTLGCFCRSAEKGRPERRYALGTCHGFANLGAAARGEPILQPGRGDGGTLRDRIGRLADFCPVQMGYAPNRVDAAIAEIPSKMPVVNAICGIGPLTGIRTPALGMLVCKHGRTTGYTEGMVFDVSANLTFDYGASGFATFVNQIGVAGIPGAGYPAPASEQQWNDWFAAPGDSGSVIVEKSSRRAIGLLAWGDPFGLGGWASPMTDVCHLLRIAIP
jgi:hypothetical protein